MLVFFVCFCFCMHYFVSHIVLQSSLRGREYWLLCFNCLLANPSCKRARKCYIYILNIAALDETLIPSCLHFSMQNIEQSLGLGRASRWSNVNQ